jgi:ribosomal protein L21E
MLRASGL